MRVYVLTYLRSLFTSKCVQPTERVPARRPVSGVLLLGPGQRQTPEGESGVGLVGVGVPVGSRTGYGAPVVTGDWARHETKRGLDGYVYDFGRWKWLWWVMGDEDHHIHSSVDRKGPRARPRGTVGTISL